MKQRALEFAQSAKATVKQAPLEFLALLALAAVMGSTPLVSVTLTKALVSSIVQHRMHSALVYVALQAMLSVAISAGTQGQSASRQIFADKVRNWAAQRVVHKAIDLGPEPMEDPVRYMEYQRAHQAAQHNRFSEAVVSIIQVCRFSIQYVALLYYVASLAAVVAVTSQVLLIPAIWWLSQVADQKYRYDKANTRVSFRSSYWSTYISRESMPDVSGNSMHKLVFRKWDDAFRAELSKRKMDAAIRFRRLFPADTWMAIAAMVAAGEVVFLVGLHNVASIVAGTQAVTMMVGGATSLAYAFVNVREQWRYVDETSGWLARPGLKVLNSLDLQTIRLEKVGYKYPTQQGWAIRDVSIALERGKLTVLVGENGAGKTTVARCILAQLHPTEGRIVLNETRELGPNEVLGELCSYLPQHTTPMEVTVREYVTLGSRYTDTEISAALARVRNRDLVRSLDLPLGLYLHDGTSVSSGQWQKLGLARTLLQTGARVVILDEPYSSVDPESEAAYRRIYRQVADHAILVVIAHRMTVAEEADQVIFVQGGRVVGIGEHTRLVSECDSYRKYWGLDQEGLDVG